MHRKHIRRVPIIDKNGKAIGIVTLDDLLMLLGDEMSEIAKTVVETFLRIPSASEPKAYHWWAAHA
jgi:CBS domain containing-hemolysin-like protein